MQRHSHGGVRSLNTGGVSSQAAAAGTPNSYKTETSEAGTGDSGNLQPYRVINSIIKM